MSGMMPPPLPADMPPPALFENVDLVILDFDGVIADSEVISLASLQTALSEWGVDLTLDEVRARYLGASFKTIKADLDTRDSARPTEEFGDFWHAALFARFREELAPIPGVKNLLDRLDERKMPFCIASSGSFERIGVALDAMALTGRFDHVFSAQLVARGKPAPDLFLHASQQVGMQPQVCLVIEDSPLGVRAAKAAGMRAVGFIGGAHLRGIQKEHRRLLLEVGADDVVGSLDSILPIPATEGEISI